MKDKTFGLVLTQLGENFCILLIYNILVKNVFKTMLASDYNKEHSSCSHVCMDGDDVNVLSVSANLLSFHMKIRKPPLTYYAANPFTVTLH